MHLPESTADNWSLSWGEVGWTMSDCLGGMSLPEKLAVAALLPTVYLLVLSLNLLSLRVLWRLVR
jgi:hypothetical protein